MLIVLLLFVLSVCMYIIHLLIPLNTIDSLVNCLSDQIQKSYS